VFAGRRLLEFSLQPENENRPETKEKSDWESSDAEKFIHKRQQVAMATWNVKKSFATSRAVAKKI